MIRRAPPGRDERFVMPSFPAGVCLTLPIVCVLDAGFILDALPSLALASCLWYRLQVRQKCDNGTKHEKIIHDTKTKK